MSSQQFQETYENIYTTGIKLLQYLQELRAGNDGGNEGEVVLKGIEEDITQALNALHEQKYQVAVIAAMKAGKSTFLNALIGADVLATETEACTVCRTDIQPIPTTETPRLLEYRQGERKPIVVASGDAESIQKRFLERTREIRTNANQEATLRFRLEHPIEAINQLSSLNGLTLVDTPGPNEWHSTEFNAVSLKETALQALRTCDAILFILDYGSFKDNTNLELLQDLIEQRQEFLLQNTGKIYFILNKIDRKTEEDRPIEDAIADLKTNLAQLGIPNPIIYPVSAWQGLLAKLIIQNTATSSQLKNFKRFFSAQYAQENAEGDLIVPAPSKIADRALEESLIKSVEDLVVQKVVENSGWNLLSDILAKLEKASRAIEDSLNIRINAWEMEIQPLRQKIEEYTSVAQNAIIQVKGVKTLVDRQETKLVAQFREELLEFAEKAKLTIQEEINLFIQSWEAEEHESQSEVENPETSESGTYFDVPQRLAESLRKVISGLVQEAENPYEIRCESEEEVNLVKEDINGFCAVLIKNWWLNTYDKMATDGKAIREELITDIFNNIQMISDELSRHIGESLNIELNINPIQRLDFEFQGIDAQVERYTESYTRLKKEKRRAFCRDYEVDIPVDDRRSYYAIDLRKTIEAIKFEIDRQTLGSLTVVERTIKKQVAEDFRQAEKQIYEYIDRFQQEFRRLLKERSSKEVEVDRVIAILEFQRDELYEYMEELKRIQKFLDSWQPSGVEV